MSKIKVLIIGLGKQNWMGGVYYSKNIVSMLYRSQKNVDLYVLTSRDNLELYSDYCNRITIIVSKKKKIAFVVKLLSFFLFHRSIDSEICKIVREYNIDYVYPVNSFPILGIKKKCIHWIPDVQHRLIPSKFPLYDRWIRDYLFTNLLKSKCTICVSSESSRQELLIYYRNIKANIIVVKFVSDIESALNKACKLNFVDICNKYNINTNYFYVPNQFWSYKNHSVVFQAINIYNISHPDSQCSLVCTGMINDARNPKYYNELLSKHNITNSGVIRILGLIPRDEQLAILNNAIAIIQPSLIEGWNTGVEESKRLGIRMILSDIPVHIEQNTAFGLIFNRFSPTDLVEKMEQIQLIKRKTNDSDLFASYIKRSNKFITPFIELLGNL